MKLQLFLELDFRAICIETKGGDIIGLFSELRLDTDTLPEGLVPYSIRHSDDDDSIPSAIETSVQVNYFGILITDAPLDFRGEDHICIDEWGFFDEEDEILPDWINKHFADEQEPA